MVILSIEAWSLRPVRCTLSLIRSLQPYQIRIPDVFATIVVECKNEGEVSTTRELKISHRPLAICTIGQMGHKMAEIGKYRKLHQSVRQS
jgi:hypothetical protein